MFAMRLGLCFLLALALSFSEESASADLSPKEEALFVIQSEDPSSKEEADAIVQSENLSPKEKTESSTRSLDPLSKEEGSSIDPSLNSSAKKGADSFVQNEIAAFFEKKEPKKEEKEDGYTIQYNTISMVEYVRFASKICKTNFIYEESDLDFTITVVADDPVTKENVMATLIQVLRAHGLLLLEQDNNLVIHKSSEVKQIAKLVTGKDDGESSPIVTRIFRIRNANPASIAAIIQPMISSSAILEVSSETKQLILTDITANVNKVAELIENLDSSQSFLEIEKYTANNNPPVFLIDLAMQIMTPIAQGNPFILVPQPMTNEIFIVSTPELVEKAVSIFLSLDMPPTTEEKKTKAISEEVYVYKVVNRSGAEILNGLAHIAENLEETSVGDANLIHTIKSAKWIRQTNSIMIVGSNDSIAKTKEFLTALDAPKNTHTYSEHTSFFIYKPQNKSADEVERAIVEMADNLREKAPEGLLDTIRSAKVNPLTQTLSFSGEEKFFPRVREILATIDTASQKAAPTVGSQFYIYRPKYKSQRQTEKYLTQVSSNLAKKHASASLVATLRSYKWIPESGTFMFNGSSSDLSQVQTILAAFDTEEHGKSGYFVYKVQNVSGELIEEELDNLLKHLQSSGFKDAPLVADVIENIRYIKQTNSLLLTGDPKAIEEVKKLIKEYDQPGALKPSLNTSRFFMYKPVNIPANSLIKSLKEIAKNLKSADLADPNLLNTIENAKYVSSTNTVVFTGSDESLDKIKSLIKDIDIAPTAHSPIQHVGKSTFLLYKLKYADGPKILTSIRNVSSELRKAPNADKHFLAALNSVKYIKETNSLFFSGDETSLEKVQSLVERFDVTDLSSKKKLKLPTSKEQQLPKPKGPLSGNFFLYRPQSISGDDLMAILENFANQLRSSGLSDPDLYQAIESVRFDEKTHSLIFTGSSKALDQIKELLKEFDIPANSTEKVDLSPKEPSIQAIDNTSFLVYKLQFHKGDEIQNALRQIASDLIKSSAPVNKTLLNSINSIQWLEVTNSLLCSGDQDTLTRLRELIKNLDIPLKQVFIEMLVIQTNLSNALTFGLEWGGNYKYRNKFGAGTYNSQPISSGGSPSTWLQNLSGFQPPTEPNPVGKVPVSSGFDLGVIGEVIKHNGQSFLTLGSLLSALQMDDETSVIMTPKILTQDGRTSTIFVGENVPFVGSFVQNNGQNTVNTSNIEYRDIGFNLTITPVLGNSDIVTLDINLDRSQTTTDATGATINLNSLTAQGIVTSKTTMQTTVHVPDNNFLILSGMVNNSNVKSKAAIPCLGGLPLVGAAFSKNNDTISNSNVVIFIRPHIINSIEDMKRITSTEEESFRDQQGTPFLEKNFDEGMELIKTVDDE